MSEQTPAEKLHDAIHEYVAAIADEGDGGTLAHSVLAYEKTQIVLEEGVDPLISQPGYSVGPGTTVTTAVGLVRIVGRAIDRIADEVFFDEDADDD